MEQKVYHWWPGRVWAGPCPIPSWWVKQAKERGSRYMTFAYLKEGNRVLGVGVAYCCPKDVPSRSIGRAIALGRARKDAE